MKIDEQKIVEEWEKRLEIAHKLQDEAKSRGEQLPSKLPNGLPVCPVATTVSLVGNRWRPLIVRELLSGTKRFGQLQRAISGVSQKVLTQNLREMEAAGLVTRQVYPEVPPRVEYSLTEVGFSLEPVIDSMWGWGAAYQQQSRAVHPA